MWNKDDYNKFHLIDIIDGMKKIPDNSVDIVLSDPPYNIGKDFGICKDNMELTSYLEWCDLWIDECKRIIKPTGVIYIYGFSEILAHISVRIDLPKRWLIWHYTNKTTPSYKGWQRSHESILYIWKDKPVFNRDAVRVPYTETFLKNSSGKKRTNTGTARFGNSSDTVYTAHENGALPRDVFTEISTLAGGAGRERYFLYKGVVYPSKEIKKFPVDECIKHPTQKPSKLTEKLIKASLPEKDGVVVIPFGGSGTEGVVCKRMGVDFIGFDINDEYIKLAEGALEQYKTIY
jgi:site-specific DNA-methyltransferase (adenine-specific)